MKKVNQNSKKTIFARAWSLFRKYELSFSQALTKAWNDFKRSELADTFNSIPCNRQFAKKKEEAKMLWKNFAGVDFLCAARNTDSNSAASIWYDGKTYNAD